MDFVVIGAMIYFANFMGTYFPENASLKREKDKDEIIKEEKNELKNILNMTLCNYLENVDSIKKTLNLKYFKNKFDKNKAEKYNEDIIEVRKNVINLQKQKMKIMNSFNKADELDLNSISFPELDSKIKLVIKELEDRRLMEEEDTVNNLEDIYILFTNYDFYLSKIRRDDLLIKRELFFKEIVPNKFKNFDKNKGLTDEEVYEIFKYIIIIEFIKEKAHKDDNDISEIILLCSLWKFCLYFKDIIQKIDINKEFKVCLHKISELHFKDFYLKNKNPDENEEKFCNFEELRNKLCNDLLPNLVNMIEDNKVLNHRLIDFFENESVDDVSDEDLMFNMIV